MSTVAPSGADVPPACSSGDLARFLFSAESIMRIPLLWSSEWGPTAATTPMAYEDIQLYQILRDAALVLLLACISLCLDAQPSTQSDFNLRVKSHSNVKVSRFSWALASSASTESKCFLQQTNACETVIGSLAGGPSSNGLCIATVCSTLLVAVGRAVGLESSPLVTAFLLTKAVNVISGVCICAKFQVEANALATLVQLISESAP